MLKTKLLHPEILMALGSNGHGAKILIADGNFPISTCAGKGTSLERQKRFEFYQQVKSEDTCLSISTGETRLFANILITVGRIKLAKWGL